MELYAGNWKMNRGGRDSLDLVEDLLPRVKDKPLACEVVLCPPASALFMVAERVQGTGLQLGCQNIFYEEKGAYTGEISPAFVREAGCTYAILGHSERRMYFGEGGEALAKKVEAALQWDLTPILCVGEKLEEREKGEAWAVVERQLKEALQCCNHGDVQGLVVAYEPVWAIGTGLAARPQDAQEMAESITKSLDGIKGLRVLYGGSVKPDNAGSFLGQNSIQGALVGGASLDADSFWGIVDWQSKETGS